MQRLRTVFTGCIRWGYGHPAAVAAAALVAVTGAVYLPTLGGEFVYDDRVQILIMDYLHKPAHLLDVLSLRVLAHDVLDHNRPMQILSLMLDALIWKRNPLGYRLSSLLLHGGTVLLVFAFGRELLREGTPSPRIRSVAASAGALVFALHPVMVETVSAASFREDLLVTLFALGALALAVQYRTGAWKTGGAIVLLSFCAVAAKESGVAVPVLLGIYWLLFGRRGDRAWWLGLLVVSALVAGLFLVARFRLAPDESTIFLHAPPRLGGSFVGTLKIQPRIWVHQLRNIVYPVRLGADYGPYSVRHIGLGAALGILAAVALAAAGWSFIDRRAGFAAACFMVPILPASNLMPMYRPMADRYMYMPMIGIALAVMVAADTLARQRYRRRLVVPAACAMVVAVVCLGALTARHVRVWRTRLTLWQHSVVRNPFSTTAHNNLAYALLEAGRPYLAIQHWERAIHISDGRHADAWAGLALGLHEARRYGHAWQAYRKAVDIEPRYGDPEALRHSLFWEEKLARRLMEVAAHLEKPDP